MVRNAPRLRLILPKAERVQFEARDLWLWLLSVSLLGLIYSLCAGMRAGLFDAPERCLAMNTLGLSHPTGAPLHSLLGHTFLLLTTQLLQLDPTWSCNLFSVLSAAMAGGMIYLTLRQLTTNSGLCMLVTLAVGTAALPWSQAVYAEVYALHWLMLSVFMFFWVRWLLIGMPRSLYMAMFWFGLSAGTHMSTVFFLPGLVVCALIERRDVLRRPKTLIAATGFLLIGLTWIIFIYVRSRTALILGTDERPDHIVTLLGYLTGKQFGHAGLNLNTLQLLAFRSTMGLLMFIGGSLAYGAGLFIWGLLRGMKLRGAGLCWMGLITWLVFNIYFGVNESADYATLMLPIFVFIPIWMLWGAEFELDERIREGQPIREARFHSAKNLVILIAAQLILFPAMGAFYNRYAPTVDMWTASPEAPQPPIEQKVIREFWECLGKVNVLQGWDKQTHRDIDTLIGVLESIEGQKLLIAVWDMETALAWRQYIDGRLPDTWIVESNGQRRFYNYEGGLDVRSDSDLALHEFGKRRIFYLLKMPPGWAKSLRAVPGAQTRNLDRYSIGKQYFYLYELVPIRQ
ncbi:DUF2723 domain-containing protein [Candidatus Sumerlaeota bacterium]|nr:DUF2723 domain-containing protein [Candidatus Sumerlaeota bacterium]